MTAPPTPGRRFAGGSGTRVFWWVAGLHVATAIGATIQELLLANVNNFRIYRGAFYHLIQGVNLYAPYPAEHTDLFKYSPTFAFLFAPFAAPPLPLGLLLWNLLNVVVLVLAVRRLVGPRTGALVLALLFFEVLRTTQRCQSNALIAGLLIIAFLALEDDRRLGAAFAVACGAFVKIFPLAAASLALFHRRKTRFALALAGCVVAFALLPLLVVAPAELLAQYRSWRVVELRDALDRWDSVMAVLQLVAPGAWPNWPVQLAGTALLLLPLALRPARWADYDFRRLFLCSLLVYVVLFNHQAESPTFVIAVTGIAVWYATAPAPKGRLRHALMALTIVFVSLSSEDITPGWLRVTVLEPYHTKTIACLAAWIAIQLDLLGWGAARSGGGESGQGDVAAAQASA